MSNDREQLKQFFHQLGMNVDNLPKVGRKKMKFGTKEEWKKLGEELKKINVEGSVLEILGKAVHK
jgi:hypothetical protein